MISWRSSLLVSLTLLAWDRPVTAEPRAAASPTSASDAALARGVALLADDDVKGAIAALEQVEGGLSHEQVLRHKESLGVALAYAGRKQEAHDVFLQLLAVAPGYALPYTISPRATFVFEEARRVMSRQRAAEVELALPPAIPFDQPVDVTLTCRANPLDLVQRLLLCQRVKAPEATYSCVDLQRLEQEQPRVVSLPPIPASTAGAAGTEGEPVVLQLAVVGYDARSNEIYRGPSRERPKEVLVGVEVPAPWYASPWLWGGIGALVLAAGVSGAVAVLALQPSTARLSGELAP